jgi:hypothetical protein
MKGETGASAGEVPGPAPFDDGTGGSAIAESPP